MIAAFFPVRTGLEMTVWERRVSPEGRTWGEGMAMSRIVIQNSALPSNISSIRGRTRRQVLA
jgi:ribulose 1,5-bisphosphate synthetase/thiazole synthase